MNGGRGQTSRTQWKADTAPRTRPGEHGQRAVRTRAGSVTSGAPAFVEDILHAVQRDWLFMQSEDCNVVEVALSLLDESSLGKADDYDAFVELSQRLEKALQSVVHENYQAFNSSVGFYPNMTQAIQDSQTKIRGLRDLLSEAKSTLASRRSDLAELAALSSSYTQVLRTADKIQGLQQMVASLEQAIAAKHFLESAIILREGIQAANDKHMCEIPALNDLRQYFSSQESSLTEILLEELNNHIYLNSPFCSNRWAAYNPENESMPQSKMDLEVTKRLAEEGVSVPMHPSLEAFQQGLTQNPALFEKATTQPEETSFQYIWILLASLHRLNKLPDTLSNLKNAMSAEISKIVDKTINECLQRHSVTLKPVEERKALYLKKSIETDSKDSNSLVIKDFFWSFFSKLDAVLQAHRVVHDVVNSICSLATPNINIKYDFEICVNVIKTKVINLMSLYITENNKHMSFDQSKSLNSIFLGHHKRSESIFQLATNEMNDDMKSYREELDDILRMNVPGLVSGLNNAPLPEPIVDHDTFEHRLVAEANVSNMLLLIKPTIALIERIDDLLPSRYVRTCPRLNPSPQSSVFFDEFIIRVFLPQLEGTAISSFAHLSQEADADEIDPQWPNIATFPITKFASSFRYSLQTLSNMIDAIPHRNEKHESLLISMLSKASTRCADSYAKLTMKSNNVSQFIIVNSAKWVNEARPSIYNVWMDNVNREEILQNETVMEMNLKGDLNLSEEDVITERKNLRSLVELYTSIRWLSQIKDSKSKNDFNKYMPEQVQNSSRWKNDANDLDLESKQNDLIPLLSLSSPSAKQFDEIITSFETLAETCIFTVRTELRSLIVYYIEKALLEGDYASHECCPDIDPFIAQLILELTKFDEITEGALPGAEYGFIFRGASELMEHLLIEKSKLIQRFSDVGALKMQTNILALQQALRMIHVNPPNLSLSTASEFWQLYSLGPKGLIERAKNASNFKFSYEQAKTLITLHYNQNAQRYSQQSKPEKASKSQRSLNEDLLQLNEILWNKQ